MRRKNNSSLHNCIVYIYKHNKQALTKSTMSCITVTNQDLMAAGFLCVSATVSYFELQIKNSARLNKNCMRLKSGIFIRMVTWVMSSLNFENPWMARFESVTSMPRVMQPLCDSVSVYVSGDEVNTYQTSAEKTLSKWGYYWYKLMITGRLLGPPRWKAT